MLKRRFRLFSFFGLLAAAALVCGIVGAHNEDGRSDSLEVSESVRSGGDTTVSNASRNAFTKPLANLPTEKLRDFTFGNKMFNTKWVTAPASVTSLDGLGPTFNQKSCDACHFLDGRGRAPAHADEPMNSMLVRLSVSGSESDGGPMPHPAYGLQLNDRAILGIPAEGIVKIFYEDVSGTYVDGTSYTLRKPKLEFFELAFGPLGDDTLTSARVAPAVYGLGLLEAIPEATLLHWADPDDLDGDGISGRVNRIQDGHSELGAVGRFGWKANVASLRLQDAGAAQGDMGITTSLNPVQNCPEVQKECRAAPEGGNPEMSDEQLAKMTFYVSTLAVPARRDMDDEDVRKGAALFTKMGCAACHKPQAKTGAHDIPQLAFQDIQPFSDLLLHDMGPDLADGRQDYEATGSEWRTPPLWGIGLVKTVNKHTNFLHDGRARSLEEAVLWHGGEGKASKDAFRALESSDRAALIRFLESL